MTDHPWNKVSQAAKELLERARPEGNEAPITFRRDDEGRCLLSPTPLRWGGPKGGVAAQLAKRNVPSFFSQLGEERGALVLCPDLRGLASDILLHLVGKNPLPNHPPTGESWIVEFSQPNTHKAFHVGHFRNVVTGDFLVRLARFGGHDVIAANYIGDIGTHVLRAMVGWERAGCPDPPTQGDLAKWLGGFYSEWAQKEGEACESFVSVLHQNLEELIALYPEKKELVGIKKRRLGRNRRLLMSLFQSALQGNLPWAESEAETWKACLEIQDEIATRWAQKDKALIRDWERTRAWSIDSFNEIYDALEIPFDHVWYESEVEEEAQRIGKELLERGLATEEDGAVLVDFKKEPYNEPKKDVLMLLRRDGLPLYSAKDLALARLKERMFSPDQSLYVVAVPQSLYFSQIFTILEQGDHAPKLTHLAYEMVNLPEGKMSSRSGSAIPFSDLWEDALERVGKRCRNPEGKDVPLIAQGALKHAMLSRDFNKKVLFDWESVLSTEGRTGCYLQYAGVRAKRLLEKGGALPPFPDPLPELSDQDQALLFQLLTFPVEMNRSLQKLSPVPLVDALHRVAKAFTDLYHAQPVLKAPESERALRLYLCQGVVSTFERGLGVLGIQLPSSM